MEITSALISGFFSKMKTKNNYFLALHEIYVKWMEKNSDFVCVCVFSLFKQSNPYGLKESGPPGADMGAWTSAGLQPTTGYYPYDPALAAYG